MGYFNGWWLQWWHKWLQRLSRCHPNLLLIFLSSHLGCLDLSGQSTSHTSGNVTIHGIEHLALSAVLWTNCLAMSILYKQLRKQNALGCFREVGMKVLEHLVQCSLVVVYPLWWSAVDRKACLSGGWVGCEVLGGLIEGQTPEFWACFSGFTGFDSGRVTA